MSPRPGGGSEHASERPDGPGAAEEFGARGTVPATDAHEPNESER